MDGNYLLVKDILTIVKQFLQIKDLLKLSLLCKQERCLLTKKQMLAYKKSYWVEKIMLRQIEYVFCFPKSKNKYLNKKHIVAEIILSGSIYLEIFHRQYERIIAKKTLAFSIPMFLKAKTRVQRIDRLLYKNYLYDVYLCIKKTTLYIRSIKRELYTPGDFIDNNIFISYRSAWLN